MKIKRNWLIVCHVYHIDSYGFYSKILLDATKKEAKCEALLLADKHKKTCRSTAAKAFLLPDTILILENVT